MPVLCNISWVVPPDICWLSSPFVLLYQKVCCIGSFVTFSVHRETTLSVFVFRFLNLTSRVCFSTQWDTLGTRSICPAAVSTVNALELHGLVKLNHGIALYTVLEDFLA